MNILILGKGYIGFYLNNYLSRMPDTNVTWLSKSIVDYTNPADLYKYFASTSKPDWIINASGYTGRPNVEACELDKENCLKYNVLVPLQLTEAANYLGIPIIHIGSGCVYTGHEKEFEESDPTNFGASTYESSFYSKTKDLFEKASAKNEKYIFRIRIPFNGVFEPKNYLYKILSYKHLISCKNSITCVGDLVEFVGRFINKPTRPPTGIYNVVNENAIEAAEVVEMLSDAGLMQKRNPDYQFVSLDDAKFKVARSNCVLSTSKINSIGCGMPDVRASMLDAIDSLKQMQNIIDKMQ